MFRAKITSGDFANLLERDGLDSGVFLGVVVVAETEQFIHAGGEGDAAQVLPGDFLVADQLGLGT